MEMEKTLEQIMEHPLAKVREFHEEMKAEMRTIQADTDVTLKEMKANQLEMIANMDAWKEGMEVCVGKLEANRKKSDAVVEHHEVPNEEAAVETTGTWKGRCEDQGQTVGSQNPLKRQTKDNVVQGAPKGRMFEKGSQAQPTT
jgi:hypothetical protein